jgi:probable addiction module antidote protein
MLKTAAKKPAKTITAPYDVAEHLRTPEEMAAYLDAWFKEAPADAAGIARALGDIARAKGMTQVAKDSGLSRESLYRALSAARALDERAKKERTSKSEIIRRALRAYLGIED